MYPTAEKITAVAAELAGEFIKALRERGGMPWDQGFAPELMCPYNPCTGTIYQGSTRFLLLMSALKRGFADPRYLTFNHARALGGHVRRGEKAITCIRYQKVTYHTPAATVAASAAPPDPERGSGPAVRQSMFPCTYAVFNVTQIEGLNLPPPEAAHRLWTEEPRPEAVIARSGAQIVHARSCTVPHYELRTDTIHLPEKGSFFSAERYYATALHELCHWTGHPRRLNRHLETLREERDLAREELRAEIGSSLLLRLTGLEPDLRNCSAYVRAWVALLEDNPREILKATAAADRITGFLLAPFGEEKLKDCA